jgi:predicted ester cyclase
MSMSVEATRQVMEQYAGSEHGDTSMMSPDVVFRLMPTGEEYRTPEGVLAMLQGFYHGAFEATAETSRLLVGEGQAALEGTVVGKHTGEFAGVAATGKDVRVPIAVFYDLAHDMITEGRVYLEVPVFLAQVTGG